MTNAEAQELSSVASDMKDVHDGIGITGVQKRRNRIAYQELPKWAGRIQALVTAHMTPDEGGSQT